ncbi:MAG: MFS transporter [Pseudomonadota bacterium]
MPTLAKLAYGIGIFGPMMGWVAAMQYLMYFYTEVIGLEPTQAGLVFLIGMAWDAISDPLIGTVADRTRTRWGRYRPYLLFGALPYGASIAWLFTPADGNSATVFLAVLAAHIAFRTGYTLVYMPYTAMIARMTVDYDSRTTLTAYKTFFIFSANLTVSFSFYPLVMSLGDGVEAQGFLPAAALFGVIAAITVWACFWFTDESALRHNDGTVTAPLRSIPGDMWANGPFLRVFAGVAIAGGFYGAELAMVPYIAKYWFNDAALSRALFTTQAVLSLLSVPVWLWLGRRYGKRFVWVAGTALAGLSLLVLFALESRSVPLTALLYGLNNIGATGFILIFYAMAADTVDWGEAATGRRHEGVVFGAISFANKFAAGIATASIGVALAAVGFVSDLQQSEATLTGIRLIALVAPAGGFLVSALLMLGYPLTRQVHADALATKGGA